MVSIHCRNIKLWPRFKFFNLFLVLVLEFCTLEEAFEAKEEEEEEEENITIQRPNDQQYSLFEGRDSISMFMVYLISLFLSLG